MIVHRLSSARGHADPGWLLAAHTFSFANNHDRDWMGSGRCVESPKIASLAKEGVSTRSA